MISKIHIVLWTNPNGNSWTTVRTVEFGMMAPHPLSRLNPGLYVGVTPTFLLNNNWWQPGGMDIVIYRFYKCIPQSRKAPTSALGRITNSTIIRINRFTIEHSNIHSSSPLHSGHSWIPSWHRYLCSTQIIILLHLPFGIDGAIWFPRISCN